MSLELLERFPDEPRRGETRLLLQAAAAFLSVAVYAGVKVKGRLRGGGHDASPNWTHACCHS